MSSATSSQPDYGSGRLFYSDFTGGLIQELRVGDPDGGFANF